MSNYIITTDATCDMPKKYWDKYDVPIVPIFFSLNVPQKSGESKGIISDFMKQINMEYKKEDYRTDTTTMTMKEFYSTLANGATQKTSQPNAYVITEVFEPILQKGKDILHISFSSAMSGTYNSVLIAQKELLAKYPDRKIIVVDTLSGGGGLGLGVIDALGLQDEGKTMEEVAKYIESHLNTYHHFFIMGDLKFLARSGRMTLIQEKIGSLLGINIILAIDNAGKVTAVAKVRGKKKAMRKLVDLAQEFILPSENEMFFGHGDALEDVQELAGQVQEVLPQIKEVDYDYINFLVGSNSGPKTIVMYFRGKPRIW